MREGAVRDEIAHFLNKSKICPRLDVVLVGSDPASHAYVKLKEKACHRVGIDIKVHRRPQDATTKDIKKLISHLSRNKDVHGLMVQLPLPKQIDRDAVLNEIPPEKDVDAFHPESVGYALIGLNESMAPCTPQGVLQLLDSYEIEVEGKDVTIINHSNLVGKPLAAMLMNRDATVTVCHKKTKDLLSHTRQADIIVSATGVENLITADSIKDGAVVVDVGIVRNKDGTITGDVAKDVWNKASYVSPVPGGVGPMTISVLLDNTVRAYGLAIKHLL